MAVLRERPYAGLNFLVDLGDGNTDGAEAGLAEVIFPDARVQVCEYRNGNYKEGNPEKITTATQYGNLIVKRGVIGSLNWYQWWNQIRNGDQSALRTVIVKLLNEDRTAAVLTWKFIRARPLSHRFSTLNARENETLVETLELGFERLEME